MKKLIAAAFCGLIFGLGLIVAGMANPAKVLAFLDLAGAWNPSLAFVMGGAIGVAIIPFTLLRRRTLSLLGEPMQFPTISVIDLRLVGGSLLFGIGWGMAGICPGPAVVLLGAGIAKGAAFLLVMIVGMLLVDRFDKNRKAD